MTGHPEASVRALLARPALLAVLVDLGTRSRELQMSPTRLFFRMPGPLRTGAELAWLLETSLSAADAFFGQARQVVPYR